MAIHPTAVVHELAKIDPTAEIGPFVVIDGPVKIGAECRLASGVTILGATTIGARTRIHAHAVIGDVPQDRAYHGEESFVVVGEDCVIREGATIHRGTQPGTSTSIGARCFIMTNAHIGHNCIIEDDVTMISGSLLGGHVHVGSRAVISGNAAVHQFVRVGELSMISGLGKIVQDIPPFFMTDRDGDLVGVNRVGLLRGGFTSQEREEIKAAYKIIYRSGLSRQDALRTMAEKLTSPAGVRLMEFMAADSRRGISGDASEQRLKGSAVTASTSRPASSVAGHVE